MKKILIPFAFLLLGSLSACGAELQAAGELEGELWASLEEFQPLEQVDSLAITPDDEFDTGTFCRWYYDGNEDEFFATFGTGPTGQGQAGYVGGGEGGRGTAYKYFSTDLEASGEEAYYIKGGGDLATVKVDDYLYHLTGDPKGWKLTKFDTRTWEEVDRVVIELEDEEGANDQMLSYVNGMLIASSAYADDANGSDTAGNEDRKIDPSVGIHTHHHVFDLDLNALDKWVFDDTLHANGSSMVFVDGIYHFVTTTAFFGDLMVMQYDEDWNYLGAKLLIKDAQWPQGSYYDETTERFYVAYLAIEGGRRSEVSLAVFDKDWELLSNTRVTDYGADYFGGRPSLLVHEGKIYVISDKETMSTERPSKDWQCQLSVYEL